MRLIFYICVLLIPFLVTACSNSSKSNEPRKFVGVTGQWIVEEVKIIGTREDFLQSDEVDFYTFFGAGVWSNAEGKLFDFKEDGTLRTELISDDLKDKVRLRYNMTNNDIDIRAEIITDNVIYDFKVVVDKLEPNLMVWKLGNYIDVRLTRVD